jgi:hypothetical protein
MAAHRSIILSLSKDKVPVLTTHVEQDWAVARDFHHAMRETLEREGRAILYCALIDLNEQPADCGCNDGK